MKALLPAIAASALLSLFAVAPAFANADDAAWIKRCVSDNSDQGQSSGVIATYCSCMDNKMPESATQSITTWEKSHPKEQEACSAEAGWGSK